jgi:hypothetical protein
MDGNPCVVSVWDGCLFGNVDAPSHVLQAVDRKEPCHYIEGAALQSVSSVASGTDDARMAKAKKFKPRERLVRWRVSLIKGTPAKFID